MAKTFLVINADDYGMCPSITDGILHCFEQGVVTQASIMPPAPDAQRGLELACEKKLPLGVHLTLACEWQSSTWSSLTGASSLGGKQRLPPHVFDLIGVADREEVRAELYAQINWLRDRGLVPKHIDAHMAPFDVMLTAEICAHEDIPSRDSVPLPGKSLPLASLWHLSTRTYTHKVEDLLEHVRSLGPGTHMIVCHPAVDGSELRSLVSPTSRRWKWARDIRVTDMQALLDPHFLELCHKLNITLRAMPDT